MDLINVCSNDQLNFDFESKRYGLMNTDGEFLRVYYSGLNYGLLFLYDSYEDADCERKRYTNVDGYVVDLVPEDLVMEDNLKFLERLENFIRTK